MKTNFQSPASKRFALHLLALTAAAGSLTLGSCKKDKDDPKPKTKTELLTAKNWRMSASSITYTDLNSGATVTENLYATMEACEKDNFLKFETNKTYKEDEGATKCSPNDPQVENGTWDFNSDQTKVLLTSPEFNSLTVPFELLELSDGTLKVKAVIDVDGKPIIATQTYNAF